MGYYQYQYQINQSGCIREKCHFELQTKKIPPICWSYIHSIQFSIQKQEELKMKDESSQGFKEHADGSHIHSLIILIFGTMFTMLTQQETYIFWTQVNAEGDHQVQ